MPSSSSDFSPMRGQLLAEIPVRVEGDETANAVGAKIGDSACAGGEIFALRVLGDDMLPEFHDGDVIIVEPEGVAGDGSFVIGPVGEELALRQLRRDGADWSLMALNPAAPITCTRLSDLEQLRGVVIQKSKPGRRREVKRYVD